MDYSSLLSSDDELDKIENVSIEDESLHLRYYSSGEDENSNKRQRVETSTSDTMTGACRGPEDNIPDESMSSVNDSVLECSSVSVSRSSTPSVQMNSRTPTNLASTPCSSRSIIPTFLITPLSGDVHSSRSPTPVTDDISRKDQTTGSANKIDTLTSEVIKMKRQLVKVQENQSNVEKKLDILIQMLHSKQMHKKGSQKINVPAQIAKLNNRKKALKKNPACQKNKKKQLCQVWRYSICLLNKPIQRRRVVYRQTSALEV
ncbi:unnamed protein product [Mytilus edulis]|uniref:Uncharacterized protein n=1 Tax=Mytilus edulis TaxID=6550 RepID=A0A8S3Q7D0_MYTED|nr:unnamed protein product [Mytilus edulis]